MLQACARLLKSCYHSMVYFLSYISRVYSVSVASLNISLMIEGYFFKVLFLHLLQVHISFIFKVISYASS